jgi:hypothetical protein
MPVQRENGFLSQIPNVIQTWFWEGIEDRCSTVGGSISQLIAMDRYGKVVVD